MKKIFDDASKIITSRFGLDRFKWQKSPNSTASTAVFAAIGLSRRLTGFTGNFRTWRPIELSLGGVYGRMMPGVIPRVARQLVAVEGHIQS